MHCRLFWGGAQDSCAKVHGVVVKHEGRREAGKEATESASTPDSSAVSPCSLRLTESMTETAQCTR